MPSTRKTLWIALAFCCAATAALAQSSADATKKLFDAVRANDKAKVQASIAEGADVNARNALGMTAIDIAVDKGYYDLGHFLLGVRNSANIPGAASATPTPGPLASQALPVGTVQKSEVLGAPGAPSKYVTIPAAPPPPDAPAYSPPPAPTAPIAKPAVPPAPQLAPGQANPFEPAQTVVTTRPAKPAQPAAAPPPIKKAPKQEGLFDKVKNIFSEDETPPPKAVDKPADKPVDKPKADQSVGSPALAAAAPPPPPVSTNAAPAPQTAPPAASPPPAPVAAQPVTAPPPPPAPAGVQAPAPSFMDQLKGIFGSSPDKSSAVQPEPTAPTPVAAAPPAAEPPAAKPATASKEAALARLERAEARLELQSPSVTEAIKAEAPPHPAPAVVAEPPPAPFAPNLFQKIGSWFSSSPTPEPVPATATEAAPPAPAPAPEPPPPPAKPAQVASWVSNNPGIFDPTKSASSAAPLPPEAVSPPAPPAPAPIQTAARPPEPPKPAPAAPAQHATQPMLKGVPLTLGRSLILGRQQAPSSEADQQCIVKKAWQGTYCVENVDWPDAPRPLFTVNSSLYHGARAIVRYDQGKATRYHAQFNNQDFDKVRAYLESLLGPPTEIPPPKTAWLGQNRQPNTTYRWVSEGGAGNGVNAILEMKLYDDASGTFPDSQRGVLQLHRADAEPIFRELSTQDLALKSITRAREQNKR